MRRTMKLVPDARDWWKWNSIHVAGVISTAIATWPQLPEPMRERIVDATPSWVMIPVSAVVFASMVVARVRAQDIAESTRQ